LTSGSLVTGFVTPAALRYVRATETGKEVLSEQLRNKLHTLALGNAWRAWLTLLSVALMACQFSVEDDGGLRHPAVRALVRQVYGRKVQRSARYLN